MSKDTKKVYSAEDALQKWLRAALEEDGSISIDDHVYKPEPEVKFGNVDSVRPYVNQVVKLLGLKPIVVVKRQGAAKATYRWGEIRIPDYTIGGHWALTEMVVLHEIAHHIAQGSHEHGKDFRTAFVQLLKDVGKPVTAELLELAYERAGVGTLGHEVAESTLMKIGKLLRQAENAGTQEEAATFTEAAQRLAAKYSVSLAVARSKQAKTEERSAPVVEHFAISTRGKHGNAERVMLLGHVARMNDLRHTIYNGNAAVDLYGFKEDIDMTKALYESLASQMEFAYNAYLAEEPAAYRIVHERVNEPGMTTQWKQVPKKIHGVTRRVEFYSAFVSTVGRRLRDLKDKMVVEAEADPEWSEDTALAIRGKEIEVTDFFRSKFSSKRSWGGPSSRGSSSASSAGRAAGKNASFGTEKGIGR
jgi:putative metallohydrolase (TIGR04338 family)